MHPYDFVANPTPHYVSANLPDETFRLLELNLALIVGADGGLRFGSGFDLANGARAPIPEDVLAHLSPADALVPHTTLDSRVTGILMLNDGPMLVASRPILTSLEEGPIRGALIMGRTLDAAEVERLAQLVHLQLQIARQDERNLPEDFAAARSALLTGSSTFVRPLSENDVAGYALLPDIYGQPALLLRVENTREIYRQGQAGVRYFIGWFVATGVLFGAVVFFVFERLRLSRQKAETALAESQERYRTLVEYASDGIFLADAQGRNLAVNPRGCDMLGYSREEILGTHLNDLIPPEDLATSPPRLEELRAGKIIISERRLIRKDDSLLPVEISARMLPDGRLQEIVRDISKRKKAEQAFQAAAADLARSNQELQQFAYVASHDLQEPLRMVSSYLQLLHQRYAGRLGVDADEFIVFAVDGAKRMQALINDLLAYSRVGTRGTPFHRVDCALVFDLALADLQVAVQEGQATIYCDPLPAVWGDEVQLGQLFQNLIGNAIKFRSQRCPEVRVGVNRQNGHWLFRVEDNGIGIEPEYWERIFLIFQRLHTREGYSGTGVGLAVCKRIVERHGGQIWLESRPGEGTTFYFTLPAMVEAAP